MVRHRTIEGALLLMVYAHKLRVGGDAVTDFEERIEVMKGLDVGEQELEAAMKFRDLYV